MAGGANASDTKVDEGTKRRAEQAQQAAANAVSLEEGTMAFQNGSPILNTNHVVVVDAAYKSNNFQHDDSTTMGPRGLVDVIMLMRAWKESTPVQMSTRWTLARMRAVAESEYLRLFKRMYVLADALAKAT